MFITSVPSERVFEVWPTVEPMLKGAVDLAPRRFSTGDLFLLLGCGKQLLWIVVDGPERNIIAALTSRVYNLPQGRICSVDWAGGEDHRTWVDEFLRIVEKYAKNMGCDIIEYIGRPGWAKYVEKHGWSRQSVAYEKEL